MRLEHEVGSLSNCISKLQQQAFAQRLELQDAQHGYIESRREQVRLKEELYLKEMVLRDTQIRHEMGEMKRAQEQRVDEISRQKLRENHETIQKLTSQLQEMQDQMNSVNYSGEFQEVESNYSGSLSYVSSQPAMIPSSRSSDKRLPLDTWNQSGCQENVFGNQSYINDSSRNHPEGIHSSATQREQGSVPQATGPVSTRDDKQNTGTIPMPTFAGRPSIMSSTILVGFSQNSMVRQQRQQISELQYDKFPSPQSFLVWKLRFKNQVTTSSCFPSEAMLWIKEGEIRVISGMKSSRSVSGKIFPNFEMLDAKIASALNKIIHNPSKDILESLYK